LPWPPIINKPEGERGGTLPRSRFYGFGPMVGASAGKRALRVLRKRETQGKPPTPVTMSLAHEEECHGC